MDREDLAILAVGDNVVDKYLSRGKMYPGGQCVNTCVYAQENGVRAAYLGVCGEGVEAQLIEDRPVDDPTAYAEAVCSLMK